MPSVPFNSGSQKVVHRTPSRELKTLPGNFPDQNYFQNNIEQLFVSFTVLAIALMVKIKVSKTVGALT